MAHAYMNLALLISSRDPVELYSTATTVSVNSFRSPLSIIKFQTAFASSSPNSSTIGARRISFVQRESWRDFSRISCSSEIVTVSPFFDATSDTRIISF